MSYSAKILADSFHDDGPRLTTMEVTFPRIVLAEFNTHRIFSRNSASSRAIPVAKMLERVQNDPFIPIWWGKNQKGMRAAEELSPDDQVEAEAEWLVARDYAVSQVRRLMELDLHKQIANRLLEPFLWHTVICTATDWANFFALRTHPDAQPEIRVIATMMKELYTASAPTKLQPSGWHLPLVPDVSDLLADGLSTEAVARISCARCARVSYLTHDGVRDPSADLELAARLQRSGHMSPFEHVAKAVPVGSTLRRPGRGDIYGNFAPGWFQYRKTLNNERVFGGALE